MNLEDDAKKIIEVATKKALDVTGVAEQKAVYVVNVAEKKAKNILHKEDPPEYFIKHARDFNDHTTQDHLKFEQIIGHQNATDKTIELNHKEVMNKLDPVVDIVLTVSKARTATLWIAGSVAGIASIIIFGKTVVVFILKLIQR